MDFHEFEDYSLGEHSPYSESLHPQKKDPQPESGEQNADVWLEKMYAPVTQTTSVNQTMTEVSIEPSKCNSQVENDRLDQTMSETILSSVLHERQNSHPNNHSENDGASISSCKENVQCSQLIVITPHTQERMITTANDELLRPGQANTTASGEAVDFLKGEMPHTAEKIINNVSSYGSTTENAKNALSKENLALSAAGKIIGIQDVGLLQAAGDTVLDSTSYLTKEGTDSEISGITNFMKAGCQSVVLPSCSLNRVGEALDQTGIGKTLETVNGVIAVTKAVKNGDVSAILEDEHVQELGKKAFGIGLELTTSAVLTASGAGAVMAVASATSDMIAAAEEIKDMEDSGGHGVSFILEAGAKIALKAAMKGSGVGAALDVAAPILEPLCQKAVDEVAQHGGDLIDQAATNAGVKSILKDGIDAIISVEETATSALQLKAPMAEENLAGMVLQTGKTVFQQVAGTAGDITGSSDRIESQVVEQHKDVNLNFELLGDNETHRVVEDENSNTPVMDEAFVHIVSICAEVDMLDATTDITPMNLFNGVTMTTLVSGAINATNGQLIGEFQPIRAGLGLLEVLCRISKSKGLCTINGLSVAAITSTYEFTKRMVSNDATKCPTLFDPDGDGVVHFSDTVRALALLGLTGFAVRLAAYNFHVMFSYPTSDGLLPGFDLSLPIQVKNMSRTAQGRNWGTLDRAKVISKIFSGGNNSKVWLLGPRGFQTLLFLFEWGTMWPFQPPLLSSESNNKPDEIGLVFTNAIIPVILNHWTLFQN